MEVLITSRRLWTQLGMRTTIWCSWTNQLELAGVLKETRQMSPPPMKPVMISISSLLRGTVWRISRCLKTVTYISQVRAMQAATFQSSQRKLF